MLRITVVPMPVLLGSVHNDENDGGDDVGDGGGDDDDDDDGDGGQEDACAGNEGAICTRSSLAGDG